MGGYDVEPDYLRKDAESWEQVGEMLDGPISVAEMVTLKGAHDVSTYGSAAGAADAYKRMRGQVERFLRKIQNDCWSTSMPTMVRQAANVYEGVELIVTDKLTDAGNGLGGR